MATWHAAHEFQQTSIQCLNRLKGYVLGANTRSKLLTSRDKYLQQAQHVDCLYSLFTQNKASESVYITGHAKHAETIPNPQCSEKGNPLSA